MSLENDLILRAANGIQTERTPVWVMRQAGRILPEYRQVRASVSGFKELVTTPALASEVTIQPVDLLGVDAAIIFSDILEVPEAMGLTYNMEEGVGPIFPKTIQSSSDIDNLIVAGKSELEYVCTAIELTKKNLNNRVPLIGFAGAPWTIMSYMIEGSGSKTFSKARKFLYTEPVNAHKLLQKITDTTINYLKAQIQSGADIVQIFDSWAGILGPKQYEEFGLKYISQVCDAIDEVPVIVFAKGAYFSRSAMSKLNCQVIGMDWHMDILRTRALVGPNKTLQGNMDPCMLYSEPEQIVTATKDMLKAFGGKRHIANLGHGVYPDTNPAHVKCYIDAVKKYSAIGAM